MNEEEKKKVSFTNLPDESKNLDSTKQNDGQPEYISERIQTGTTPPNASNHRKRLAEKIKNDPDLQKKIRQITQKLIRDVKARSALFEAQNAARQAAGSETYGEFNTAIKELYKQYCIMGIASAKQEQLLPKIQIKSDRDAATKVDTDDHQKALDTVFMLDKIQSQIADVETVVAKFLRKFEIIALKNEKSSASNACWSKWLAIIAIIISVFGILASGGIQWYFAWRSEKNDKTGELIEVVKKSHPWSEQQISAEDAKNARVAFQSITGALQKNVQLEKDNIQLRQETDCLQADLKKAQNDLSEFQKKYNADKVTWTQEKQKLYAEIATLKKQIEELEIALRKNFLSSGKEQENRK